MAIFCNKTNTSVSWTSSGSHSLFWFLVSCWMLELIQQDTTWCNIWFNRNSDVLNDQSKNVVIKLAPRVIVCSTSFAIWNSHILIRPNPLDPPNITKRLIKKSACTIQGKHIVQVEPITQPTKIELHHWQQLTKLNAPLVCQQLFKWTPTWGYYLHGLMLR